MWIALVDGFLSSVFIKIEYFVVEENHILKLELKQADKKLKEDPRIEMMWEEQDQADQKKISEQTRQSFFQNKETRDKTSPIFRNATLN